MSTLKFGTNLYSFTQMGEGLDALLNHVRIAEELGFHHLRVLDHVVGIVAEKHGGLDATPYTSTSNLHECFVLLGYLAALTSKIRLVTGILVLPQRQTVLVAKQAAEVDILSGGRVTLGIGVGYNTVEFEAMGADFKTRGRRIEEQIDVLRALWTEDVVTYRGEWHQITDASLAPRPPQQPIPIFIGAGRRIAPIPPDAVLNRIGRKADGWFPHIRADDEGRAAIAKVEAAARNAGRDPAAITLEMNIFIDAGRTAQDVIDEIKAIQDIGAKQINVRFDGATVAGHTDAMKRFRKIMDHF
jgi:probable F420-dependent oxidoreductase